jgi:hypothetical protein
LSLELLQAINRPESADCGVRNVQPNTIGC